jgi:8-oxo-dGTP diphosphatase
VAPYGRRSTRSPPRHRPHYDDWTFPKGKAKDGESDKEAAIRELEEETGLTCELGNELATTHYVDRRGRSKYVRYWTMGTRHCSASSGDEIDEIAWLTRDGVARQLSYERDIAVLDSFAEPA